MAPAPSCCGQRELRFDAEGHASLRGLDRGLLRLHLCSRSTGHLLAQHGLTVDGKAATVVLDPRSAAYGPVAGRLRDTKGQPLAGVRLVVHHGSEDSRVHTVTKADGTFAADTPGGWRRQLFATIDDDVWILVVEQRGNPLRALPPPAPTFELTAVPACSVRGRVLDPDGNPVPFAALTLSAPSNTPGYTSRGIDRRAGPDGTFAFRRLGHAAVPLTLIAATLRLAARLDEIAIGKPGAHADVTIRLGAAAEVLGVVEDAKGNPIASIEVRVWRMAAAAGWREGPEVAFVQALTTRDGRFRIRGLPPGRYCLTLSGGSLNGLLPAFSLEPGEVKDMGALTQH